MRVQGLFEHTELVGLIYCCCIGCWVLEGMDQKLSGCEATCWSVRVQCR